MRSFVVVTHVVLLLTLGSIQAVCGAAEPPSLQPQETTDFSLFTLRLTPTSSDNPQIKEFLVLAAEAIKAGQTDRAIALYRQVLPLVQSPETRAVRVDILNILGHLLLTGEPGASVELFTEALDILAPQPQAAAHLVRLKEALALALLNNKEERAAEPVALESYQLSLQVNGENDATTVAALQLLTDALLSQRKYPETTDRAQELLTLSTRVFGAHHWEVARAATYLGVSQVAEHKFVDGVATLGEAMSLWDEYPNHPTEEYTLVTESLGYALIDAVLLPDPEQAFRQAIQRCNSGGYTNTAALVAVRLAMRLQQQNRFGDAAEMYEQALTWADSAPASLIRDTVRPDAVAGLGLAEYYRGDLAQAEGHLRRAVQLRTPGGDSAALVSNLEVLSRTLAGQQKYPEATQFAQAAVTMAEHTLVAPDQAPRLEFAQLLEATAMVFLAGGHFPEALQQLQRAALLEEQLYGPNAAVLGSEDYWIAQVEVRLNDLTQAERSVRRAFKIQTDSLGHGTHDEDVADDALLLAHILTLRGHRHDAEAESLFRKAVTLRASAGLVDRMQAQRFLALFLTQRHRSSEARSLLDALHASADRAQEAAAFAPILALKQRQETLNWQQAAANFCAAADPHAAVLCETHETEASVSSTGHAGGCVRGELLRIERGVRRRQESASAPRGTSAPPVRASSAAESSRVGRESSNKDSVEVITD